MSDGGSTPSSLDPSVPLCLFIVLEEGPGLMPRIVHITYCKEKGISLADRTDDRHRSPVTGDPELVHLSADELASIGHSQLDILGIPFDRLTQFALPPAHVTNWKPGMTSFRVWLRDQEGQQDAESLCRSANNVDEESSKPDPMTSSSRGTDFDEELDWGLSETVGEDRIRSLIKQHKDEFERKTAQCHEVNVCHYPAVYSLVVKARHDDASTTSEEPESPQLANTGSHDSTGDLFERHTLEKTSSALSLNSLGSSKIAQTKVPSKILIGNSSFRNLQGNFGSSRTNLLNSGMTASKLNRTRSLQGSDSVSSIVEPTNSFPTAIPDRRILPRHSRRAAVRRPRTQMEDRSSTPISAILGQPQAHGFGLPPDPSRTDSVKKPVCQTRILPELPNTNSRSWSGCNVPLLLQTYAFVFDGNEHQNDIKPPSSNTWRISVGLINEHREVMGTIKLFETLKSYLISLERGDFGPDGGTGRPGLLKHIITNDPSITLEIRDAFRSLLRDLVTSYPSNSLFMTKIAPRIASFLAS